MRTVIFRAYRANLDAAAQKKLRAELKTLTGPACVKDFYGAYFSEEDLKAHSGVLFNDYLISVFREAAQELSTAEYALIADMWSERAAACGVASIPQFQKPKKAKKRGKAAAVKRGGKRGKTGGNVAEDEKEDEEKDEEKEEEEKAITRKMQKIEPVPEPVVVPKPVPEPVVVRKPVPEPVVVPKPVAEQAESKYVGNRCSKCKEPGHNSRTCQKSKAGPYPADKRVGKRVGLVRQVEPLAVDYTINDGPKVHRGGFACNAFLRMVAFDPILSPAPADASQFCGFCYKSKDKREREDDSYDESSSDE